jgi:hypothetical protein
MNYFIRVLDNKDAYVLFGEETKLSYNRTGISGVVVHIIDKEISKQLIGEPETVNPDHKYTLEREMFRIPEPWEIVKYKMLGRNF